MKRIVIHEEYCIGCRLCEINCLVAHSKSKNILKVFKGEFRYKDAIPFIVVEEEGYTSFGVPCRHCEDAPCVESCMTGALHVDEKTGAILWDEDKCVACYMCIMTCPFGVIRRAKDSKKIASKCDLCVSTSEEIPVCVQKCPNEALTFEEIDSDGE
ncbi:MAG: 4Fe-4S dicluster domain-containing protein [Promethearchaeota archaeon]